MSLATKNPPVTKDNLLGLIQETTIDLKPAEQDFNYSPITFSDGMRKTIWGEVQPGTTKIGIIGLGKMGVLHASLINALPTTKIVALFDVDPKIRTYVYSLGIRAPFFTDVDQFLNSDLDAVFISVPPAFTRSIIEKCAAKKIHFFVEKPLANTLDNAASILETTKKHKLVNSVGYMYGYREIVKKAKEILDSGVLGTIISFDATAYVTQVLSAKKGWRYQKKTAGGGCVSLHGTHLLYLLYHFFGLPEKISSTLYFPYSSVEDKAFSTVAYNSFTGAVKVSWSEEGYPKLALTIKISGGKGSLAIEEDKLSLTIGETTKTIYREDLPCVPFELGGEGYFAQDKDFIDSLRTGKRVKVTVDDAYAVQKMVQGIYDSFEQKKEVILQ